MRRGAERVMTVAVAAAALVLVSVGVIGLVVEPPQLPVRTAQTVTVRARRLVLAGTPWVRRGLHRVSRPLPAVGDEPVLHKLEPNPEGPRSHVVAADLSTAELCLAWRRSYLVLIETPYSAGHDEVVCWRRALLDELELRDHAGFDRWIVTGARAASDPAAI